MNKRLTIVFLIIISFILISSVQINATPCEQAYQRCMYAYGLVMGMIAGPATGSAIGAAVCTPGYIWCALFM